MVKHQLGDITEFQGDAIFNSLGNKDRLNEIGAIYSSILKATNGQLHEAVKEKGKFSVEGDSFITESFGLPCKHIVHLVTPFRKDDEDCSLLKKSVFNAIKMAYEQGIRSICIPLIGAGYNGYSDAESFETIMSASKLALWECDNLEISLFTLQKEERDRLLFSTRHSSLNPQSFEEEQFKERRSRKPDDGRVHFNSFRYALKVGTSIGDLIEMYCNKNKDSFPKEYLIGKKKAYKKKNGQDFDPFISNCWKSIQEKLEWIETDEKVDPSTIDYRAARTQVMWSYHSNEKTKFKKAGTVSCWRKPSKISVIAAGIALGMNSSDIFFMCRFCGYYLSCYDPGDVVLKTIIDNFDEEDRMMEFWSEYPRARGYSGWGEMSKEKETSIYPPIE